MSRRITVTIDRLVVHGDEFGADDLHLDRRALRRAIELELGNQLRSPGALAGLRPQHRARAAAAGQPARNSTGGLAAQVAGATMEAMRR